MFGKSASVEKFDEDILSAIWVLSCIDENPIMTYRGIASRIDTTEREARKLAGSRRELFRPGVLQSRLDT